LIKIDLIFANSIDITGNINLVSYTNKAEEYMQAQRTIALNSCKDNINMSNCAYKWSNEKFYGLKVIDGGKNLNQKNFQLYKFFQITEAGDLYLQSFSYANVSTEGTIPKFEEINDPQNVIERFDEEEIVMMEREFLNGDDLDNLTNFKQVPTSYFWDFIRKSDKRRNHITCFDKSQISRMLSHLQCKNGCANALDLWISLRIKGRHFSFESFMVALDKLILNEWNGVVKKRSVQKLS
jgi:hypothetical protein